ncbi:MAG: DUF4838 domain-containing protein, partial [Verrucomicrobiota bacterium]
MNSSLQTFGIQWSTSLALVTAVFLALPAAHAAPQKLDIPDLDPITMKKTVEHDPISIVRDGKPVAVVHLAQSGGIINKLFNEFQDAIRATTGAALQKNNRAPEADQPAIVIGGVNLADEAGVDAEALEIEGFAVKTAPNRIYIIGKDANGIAWGIADFLERIVDVRWYWPLEHHGRTVRKTDTLVVNPLHYTDAPVYRMRQGWPPFYNGTPYGTLRVNDLYDRLRGGNSWPVKLAVHQPAKWHVVYKEERPEIFALREDGSRNYKMIDYAHPKTLQTFLENIELHETATDEQRKTKDFKFKTSFIKGNSITVSPPDMGVHSAGEQAQALLEPEKGRYASASKLMGQFVRDLAREVKQRWPDKTVIYLPYVNYTLAPEGIDFPDNVEVQLCGMPGLAMYKQPALREQFQGNIDRWAELTGRPVQTWDYSCWPTDRTKAPFQYPHVVKDYYMHNRDKVVGTFINGGIPDEWLAQHFTMYCWMKLMWDPEFDVDAAADEFCTRMFGPAADAIRELLRLQTDRWEEVVWQVDSISPTALYKESYTEEVMERMAELLDDAQEKAADDEVIAARVAYYAQPFEAFFEEAESLRSGKGLRQLSAQKVPDNPKIDGKLDDQWWEMAEPLVGFERKAGGKTVEAKYVTEVRAVWTLDGVTFGVKMHEPNPDALKMDIKTRDDGALWPANDNIEVFVDVTGQKLGRYWQWLINPANTVMDLQDGDQTWNPEEPKHAVHIGEDYWSIELYLPNVMFEDVEEFQKPHTGKTWAAQFTRHRKSSGPNEYSRLNNKLGGFSRNVADFGLIK